MQRALLLLAACAACGCSSGSSAGYTDASTIPGEGGLVAEGGDDEDAGIYPYNADNAAVAIAALTNDLWLSCPTYTCAEDVPVAGGVVNVSCDQVSGGGHCTYDCTKPHAATCRG
jgi:hypothetical protein